METLPEARTFLFWHRKCTIATENSSRTSVDQQTHQYWLQIWNLRILTYTRPLWLFLQIFLFTENQENRARRSWKIKFERNSWKKCLRIFFYVIFDVEFDSDTPEIISLRFRIDVMRSHDLDIMCPALTELWSSRSSRIVTPLCMQEDMIKFFANQC